MTDDKQLLKFAKSYAAKNQAFAEAIIEKFLPAENTVDYEKMVTDCFQHRKKGGRRVYGPSLDWTTIRRDIKRLLKQLGYLYQQQDGETAAKGAVFFLETLEKVFEDDCVYEAYNYSNSNFGNEEALRIIDAVMQNDKHVTRDTKLDLVKRLEKLAQSTIYRTYLPCDIDEIIDHAKQKLLEPADMLKEIDKNIQAAKYDSDRAYYVKWKISLLRELDRDNEAEEVINQYISLDEVPAIRFDQLIDDSCYDEAMAFCQERIDKAVGSWHDRQPWYLHMLELGQRIDDEEAIRKAAKWLFACGNITQDDKKKYYHLCRDTFDDDTWPAFRDQMLSESKKGNASTLTVFQLYEEERLYERMYLYLQKLSASTGYYSYDPYSNSGGERLFYFSQYARCLTEEQRKEMVSTLAKTILQDSRPARTRDRYANVAKGLYLLSQACTEGSQTARSLARQILQENPSKPAFREEVNYYDYE